MLGRPTVLLSFITDHDGMKYRKLSNIPHTPTYHSRAYNKVTQTAEYRVGDYVMTWSGSDSNKQEGPHRFGKIIEVKSGTEYLISFDDGKEGVKTPKFMTVSLCKFVPSLVMNVFQMFALVLLNDINISLSPRLYKH